jgi:hypothetical protein
MPDTSTDVRRAAKASLHASPKLLHAGHSTRIHADSIETIGHAQSGKPAQQHDHASPPAARRPYGR